jgi:hypothetical protein
MVGRDADDVNRGYEFPTPEYGYLEIATIAELPGLFGLQGGAWLRPQTGRRHQSPAYTVNSRLPVGPRNVASAKDP